MLERPFVKGGLGILVGYLEAWRGEHERYGDRAYLRHLHRYEMSSLFRGKRRTMERFHKRLEEHHAG
jgi:hypothetical protein